MALGSARLDEEVRQESHCYLKAAFLICKAGIWVFYLVSTTKWHRIASLSQEVIFDALKGKGLPAPEAFAEEDRLNNPFRLTEDLPSIIASYLMRTNRIEFGSHKLIVIDLLEEKEIG